MNNYIPKEINVDKSSPDKLIISNSQKDLSISDYLAVLCIGLLYFFCFYFLFKIAPPLFDLFSIIFVLIIFFFGTRLLISFINSIKEKQSIIISDESIEIIKKRPFFSKTYKFDRLSIRKIDFEEFGFFGAFLPTAIVGFKHSLFKYYKAPQIVTNSIDIFIFEHFRIEVREWIVEYLNKEIK